jgi:hypothetical protein
MACRNVPGRHWARNTNAARLHRNRRFGTYTLQNALGFDRRRFELLLYANSLGLPGSLGGGYGTCRRNLSIQFFIASHYLYGHLIVLYALTPSLHWALTSGIAAILNWVEAKGFASAISNECENCFFHSSRSYTRFRVQRAADPMAGRTNLFHVPDLSAWCCRMVFRTSHCLTPRREAK